MMEKILFIANPISGTFDEKKFEKCVKIIGRKTKRKVEVAFTEYPGHAAEIVKSREFETVVVCGGDGLLNEVVNGLESIKISLPKILYKIPFGTSNVFCREYNIPINPIKASMLFGYNNLSSIPIGSIGARFFTLMVGFGFDAMTVKNTDLKLKSKIGKLAYIYSGLKTFLENRFEPFKLFQHGKIVKPYHCIIAVSNRYAGNFSLSRKFVKGKLNVFYECSSSKMKLLKNILSIALIGEFSGKKFTHETIKIADVDECQIDGDFVKLENSSNYVRVKKSSFVLALPEG